MVKYTANLSRTQGRESWSIIFRHPRRKDSKGREGLRIRRGLGTSDKNKAKILVDQMNELLGNESLWDLSAKPLAERKKYHSIIISAFYDSLDMPPRDYWAIRDSVLPLPSKDDGYGKILFVGTTGAGKTTLLRQLIGSDHVHDRFPSTSTGKTTISDIEIIISEGIYKAGITFFGEAETRLLIEECVTEAVIKADEDKDYNKIAKSLLTHKEQRLRLNYLFGDYKTESDDLQDEIIPASTDSPEPESKPEATPKIEVDKQRQSIHGYIERIIQIAISTRKMLNQQLNAESRDLKGKEREDAQEQFEDLLSEQQEFGLLVDELMDEIKERFNFIRDGRLVKDSGDWPQYWIFETDNRDKFITEIRRFSSNYAPLFGRLLTPLVQGFRIRGPFYPNDWSKMHPRLILMDGQGLGHTPDSAHSIPTNLTKRFDDADTILLVDNATQPIQAASLAVLRSVGTSGHHPKLAIAFTHFDLVSGDNLLSIDDKKNHIFGSVITGLTSLKDVLGISTMRSLKNELEQRSFFLGGLQLKLTPNMRWTRNEMERLIQTLQSTNVVPLDAVAKPKYDDAYLLLALQNATKDFHALWSARLGHSYISNINSEHWSRIKALSRRIALSMDDEYGNLKPAAEFITCLREKISLYLDKPIGWEPIEPHEEKKQEIIDAIRKKVNTELHPFSNVRLIRNRLGEWEVAFWYRGQGSTRLRARDIETIFNKGAPIFKEIPSPDTFDVLSYIRNIIKEAIESVGETMEQSPLTKQSNNISSESPNVNVEEQM